MEIKVISTESIKPSKPTPNHLKTFKLSSFDLLHENIYFPIILFYNYPQITNPNPNTDLCFQLKQSLSETLTIFYPVAGRRNDAVSISCNDDGALFLEATANTTISEFLNPPKLEFLDRLLPREPYKLLDGEAARSSPSPMPHLVVQATRFECGGIAIGVCTLHALVDACSSAVMMRTWSAICRGKKEEIAWPDFATPCTVFPPRDFAGMRSGLLSTASKVEQAMCSVRRYLFDYEAINKLRAEAKESEPEDEEEANEKISPRNPSRYEALSCFITKHVILAHKNETLTSTTVVVHIVDVRRRMTHPLSQNSMGNLIWPAMVPYDDDDETPVTSTTDLRDLVKITRRRMRKINRELFVRMHEDPNFLRSDECGELLLEGREKKKKKPTLFVCTSWGNLGFDRLDFGWGNPLWVGFRGKTTQQSIPNTVVFIDTDRGIEAWLTMPMQHIAVLEKDEEFLAFASPNPSVSQF